MSYVILRKRRAPTEPKRYLQWLNGRGGSFRETTDITQATIYARRSDAEWASAHHPGYVPSDLLIHYIGDYPVPSSVRDEYSLDSHKEEPS